MRTLLWLPGSIFLVLALSGVSQAKEWRGITPLRSTRVDVEKLLGPPPHVALFGVSVYTLDEEEVRVFYVEKESRGGGARGGVECLKKVPADTVLFVLVSPKRGLKLEDFRPDLRGFVPFDPTGIDYPPYKAYYDEPGGLIIRTYRGEVDAIGYVASAGDKRRCPSYYKDPAAFVRVIVEW